MPKYHLNADGDAKLCKATQRACKYGNEQSHYDTPEDARKAFETRIQSFSVNGKLFQTQAQALISSFCDKDGYYVRPKSSACRTSFKPVPGTPFLTLDSGVENNVYVNAERQFVYKIPNSFSIFIDEEGEYDEFQENIVLRNLRNSQEPYGELDINALRKQGYDYITTVFLTCEDKHGSKIPVIVQEYLDEHEWVFHELGKDKEDELKKNFPQLDDLHRHNVKRNINSGRVLLIDCLNNM